jgi:hypothetical protein
VVDHFEARLGGPSIHRGDRAQPHKLLIVFQESANTGDFRRRDFQRELAELVFAAEDRIGVEGFQRRRNGLFSQIVGYHYRFRRSAPDQSSAPFFQM